MGMLGLILALLALLGLGTYESTTTTTTPGGLERVELAWSGGFDGMPEQTVVVTDAGQLATLADLVPDPLPPAPGDEPTGCADCYEYHLVLIRGGFATTYDADDASLPDGLSNLVDRLRAGAAAGEYGDGSEPSPPSTTDVPGPAPTGFDDLPDTAPCSATPGCDWRLARLALTWSGGFTGQPERTVTIVDPAELDELAALLPAELPAVDADVVCADCYDYRLVITPADGDPITVEASDASLPASLGPVVAALRGA